MGNEEFRGTREPLFKDNSTWLIASALIVVVTCIFQLSLPLNHDAAWHFEVAMRVLKGARLGRDVYDVNPPMTAWLLTIPALFVSVSGAPASLVYKAFVVVIMAGVLLVASILLRRTEPDRRTSSISLCALAFALYVLPGYDFGQREHLVAALTLPYVLLAAARVGGIQISARIAIPCAVAAALAVGVKPHFLALPLAVEAWLCWRTRCLVHLVRPELLVMASTGLLYIVAVYIFAPDYFLHVVPDAALTYGAFQNGVLTLALDFTFRLVPFVCAILLSLTIQPAGRTSFAMGASIAAAIGYFVAAVAQEKGWAYQMLPVEIYCVLFVGLSVSTARADRLSAVVAIGAATIIAISSVGALFTFVEDGFAQQGTGARVRALAAVFSKYAGKNHTVFGFITSPRDVHPAVVLSRSLWGTASGVMVFLPAMLNEMAHPGPHHSQIMAVGDRRNRECIAEIRASKPGVIVVDASSMRLAIRDTRFNYLKFFSHYPKFVRYFAHYHEIQHIGEFRIFVRDGNVTAISSALPK